MLGCARQGMKIYDNRYNLRNAENILYLFRFGILNLGEAEAKHMPQSGVFKALLKVYILDEL